MERPLHYLQWHITHSCNLRCTHCYQQDYSSHMQDSDLFQTLDAYCSFLKEKNLAGQINLTGGEPLLHPRFFELAAEIRRRGLRLGVLTNGTLIDPETACRLAELKPVFVQVSLDGTEKQHDAIRGRGAFREALRGIDCLKAAGIKVLVSFTVQKANRNCFGRLACICRHHKVDKLWFDRVVTDSPESTEKLALTTRQFSHFVIWANIYHRLYHRKDGTSLVSVSRSLQAINCKKDGCYRCSAGDNLLIILANGDMMPCRRLPFVIGNVKDAPIAETLRKSPVMNELRRITVPKGCAGCQRLSECRGGARCVTYAQTGELHRRDINCFYRQNKAPKAR